MGLVAPTVDHFADEEADFISSAVSIGCSFGCATEDAGESDTSDANGLTVRVVHTDIVSTTGRGTRGSSNAAGSANGAFDGLRGLASSTFRSDNVAAHDLINAESSFRALAGRAAA